MKSKMARILKERNIAWHKNKSAFNIIKHMKNLYGEGGYEMKIFDENGNFLGEFIENSVDKMSDSFHDSVGAGCLSLSEFLFLIGFVAAAYVIYIFCRALLKAAWWIFRLPFYMIVKKDLPEF